MQSTHLVLLVAELHRNPPPSWSHRVPPWCSGSVLDHRSLLPVFESRRGYIWRLFHLWLRFITFGGRSAHLVYHVHKIIQKLLEVTVVGLPISHVWTVGGGLQTYNGKIAQFKFGKSTKQYVVAYWQMDKTCYSAVNYELSLYYLACDFMLGDLII